ncbi:hypothetical protein Barb4_01550 [Bacteroidales bacterium Barb4]|nr:hypothetical protein Barb4_01550 [Bacteroidales bacterium Barb4]
MSSFQDFLDGIILITPHFATLHVGLKSGILSGYLWLCHHCNSILCFQKKSCTL